MKCKAVEPVLAQLAAQHPGVVLAVADADTMPTTAAAVRYTPTFVVFRSGTPVDEFVGTNATQLRDRVWLHDDA